MSTKLTKEQLQTLGMADATPAERDLFLMKVGKVVFDSAILRLLESLNEEQLYALNHAIDSYDSFDAVLEYLQVTHPMFMKDLEQEQNTFIERFANNIGGSAV